MSIMRCEVCEKMIDTDHYEMFKLDDLDSCFDCYDKEWK